MFFAVTRECDWFRALRAFHGHQKLLFPRTGSMKGKETRRLGALNAGSLSNATYRAFLKKNSLIYGFVLAYSQDW